MTTVQLPSPRRWPLAPIHIWIASLLIVIAVGTVGVFATMTRGLQVTNLTDRVPWGLWITQDLTSIAMGAGAFTFSAIVYLFRIKRFEPVARLAVFVGFLGYTSAMIVLAMDIGRPDRFWHPIVYWNVHSVLWEITMCVIFYSTVLVIEVIPIVLNSPLFDGWTRLRRLGHWLHTLTPVLAVAGLALSLLHQSSLGATYGVLVGRELWFKPSLPVLFILSAVAGGIALTLLLALVVELLTGRVLLDRNLRRDVARFAAFALLAYLYLKLWDWAATSYYSQAPGAAEALQRLAASTPYNQTFWILEVLLGAVVPAIILLSRPLRRNRFLLMLALVLVVTGVTVNRWNVTLSGLVVPPQWSPGTLGNIVATPYFPSLTEAAVAVGVLGYALLVFTLGVRYLPLFPPAPGDADGPAGQTAVH